MAISTRLARRRWQFSLRSLMVLIVLLCLSMACWRWLGGGVDASVFTFLLAVIPFSYWLEHATGRQHIAKVPWTLAQLFRGLLFLACCTLIATLPEFRLLLHSLLEIEWDIPTISLILFAAMLMESALIAISFGESAFLGISFGESAFLEISLVTLLSFVAVHGYLAAYVWPRPIPWRVPILMAIFSVLYVVYVIADTWRLTASREFAVGAIGASGVMLAGIWWLWWRNRQGASRLAATTLAVLFHWWLFGLAFLPLGAVGESISHSLFNLDGMFDAGPAPPVQPEDWAKLRIGMSEDEVVQILGEKGHHSGGGTIQIGNGPTIPMPYIWEYNWHGENFLSVAPDARAYVIWFDEQGRVKRLREPLASQ